MEWLKKVIDNALKKMSTENILMMTPRKIPDEMLDKSIPPSNDGWKGWKPIQSTTTNVDIEVFEKEIGFGLPKSYKEFLKYKHFFCLRLPDIAVNLPGHLPDKPLSALREYVFQSHEPELIIERGYIYFADFHDYGLLCFDTNEHATDNEYKVVYMDYENTDNIFLYANNFQQLLEADSEKGNDFIDKLNEYYK